MTKDVKDRVSESIVIKTQLQKLGATLEGPHSLLITKHMNEYIKTGAPQHFNIMINGNNNVIVTLSSRENTKSGISLEKRHL
jgi:hypothetical protein